MMPMPTMPASPSLDPGGPIRLASTTSDSNMTQTAFHFCLDADEGPCETTPVEKGGTQSVCGPSLIFGNDFSDNFCYYWDVHTSCSTYLIGEAILFDVPDFEIVAWGDRNAEPQRICNPCGNGEIDGGERCDAGADNGSTIQSAVLTALVVEITSPIPQPEKSAMEAKVAPMIASSSPSI